MSKEAAVEYALAHNRAYRAAFEDVSVAGEKVNQARADFFPKLDGSYAFTQLADQPFISTARSRRFQRIPFSIQTINRWEVDLVQPLFTGFGLESQYKASKVGLKISQIPARGSPPQPHTRRSDRLPPDAPRGKDSLKSRMTTWQAWKCRKRTPRPITSRESPPRTTCSRPMWPWLKRSSDERNVVKQLVVLRSNLNQLLDIDLQEKVELAGIEERTYQVPDLHQLYSAAEEKRPEYLAVKASIQQAEYSKTAARSRYYPRVSAFAQYYREGEDFAANNNPFANNENAAVGVRVDWNLFEGGKTRASELEWEYRLRGIEQRRDDLLQKIRLQVENAFEQLKVAKANIDTARVAVKQAEENDRITTLQYKEQVAIFLEVLNAQVFLAQTRADFYQAFYGYEIAKAELERAIGDPVD